VIGAINEIKFVDGQQVKKGDVLFVIDPRPYVATLNVAKAEISSAETNVNLAKSDFKRAEELIGLDAISKKIFDERKNGLTVALANLESAKAKLEQAKLNVEYAYVKAPISGKVSRAEITLGNMVQEGSNAPIITTL